MRVRRTKAEMQELRGEILSALECFHPQTTRQLFYQLIA